LATTRRVRLQLSSVRQAMSAKWRTALGQALGLGEREIAGNGRDQALVAGETEDVVDPVGLAPAHERLARVARIGPQQDLDLRPAAPDLADDPLDLLHRAR
jgi:hypothetical protein